MSKTTKTFSFSPKLNSCFPGWLIQVENVCQESKHQKTKFTLVMWL